MISPLLLVTALHCFPDPACSTHRLSKTVSHPHNNAGFASERSPLTMYISTDPVILVWRVRMHVLIYIYNDTFLDMEPNCLFEIEKSSLRSLIPIQFLNGLERAFR